MNNAIVALIRGYSDLQKYELLIERNTCIFNTINKDLKYPLVFFHEGNINAKARDLITKSGHGQQMKFVDISGVWQGGYEAMCQFQTYHIWNFCREYDYVLRIDEDCQITHIDKDPFSQVEDFVYLKSVYFAESHSETNATLPHKIQTLTEEDPADFYNDKYPYTNVGLAKVSFFTEKKMHDMLYMIAMCPDQRTYRWGDLPVLGSLLNIYAKGKVGTMHGMEYYHQSHDMTIKCG